MVGHDYRARIADSEDAAQDAVLSAFRGLKSFEYRGQGSFLAWLLRRAEFELLNRVKAARRQSRDAGPAREYDEARDADDTAQSISGSLASEEERQLIRACLDQLPERERDVIVLRQFFQMSSAKIAEEMALPSMSSVRNLYSRAQARLALVLAKRGYGEDGP